MRDPDSFGARVDLANRRLVLIFFIIPGAFLIPLLITAITASIAGVYLNHTCGWVVGVITWVYTTYRYIRGSIIEWKTGQRSRLI